MHERLCAIKGVLRAIARLDESIRTRYALTLTEALCLCSIGGGCVSAGDLAEEVGLSASRLSRVLSSLESKGLIERLRRKDDKRNWNNEMTNEGKILTERMKNEGIDIPEELKRLA
jgi:DNA-binding MarR family transcriptional regulator